VRHDVVAWRSALAPGGVLLLHDVAVRTPGFGVHAVWSELASTAPSFAFEHEHGLGIVVPDGRVPPPLAGLLSANDTEATAVRQLFAAAGGALTARRLIADLQNQVRPAGGNHRSLLRGRFFSLRRAIAGR
jgi:hypothetical protein